MRFYMDIVPVAVVDIFLIVEKTRKDNQTGVRGVSINHRTGQFVAYIQKQGKNQYLGSYATINEAAAIRKKAEQQLQQKQEHA